jgi:PAS domain-containing protein
MNTVTKVLDDTGKPIGIASTERDITERKRAEESVLKSEDQYTGPMKLDHDFRLKVV